jgi:hypothetical protein
VNGKNLSLISITVLFLSRKITSIGKNTKNICRLMIFSLLKTKISGLLTLKENISPRDFDEIDVQYFDS